MKKIILFASITTLLASCDIKPKQPAVKNITAKDSIVPSAGEQTEKADTAVFGNN